VADIHSAPTTVTGDKLAAGAPPLFPFLFITIACGAVSGFHCLVSSGTTSKQIAKETDAQYVGYGAMLLEGALAVIVILACTAGVGMGKFQRTPLESGQYSYAAALEADGSHRTGRSAWEARYNAAAGWEAFNKLGPMVGAFIEGGANFLATIGIPLKLAIGIVAVLVACFAATTLDTATRLQRYIVQGLADTCQIRPLTNKYAATLFAVLTAGAVAMLPSAPGMPLGTGGMILWPLFGATNQLLAGLAFLVTVFYLGRRNKPIGFAVVPMVLMMIFPAWAMWWNMFNPESGWVTTGNYLLLGFGVVILLLQAWMVVEAVLTWPRAKGVLEEALPPLHAVQPQPQPAVASQST
jgi:carbon starvation protein